MRERLNECLSLSLSLSLPLSFFSSWPISSSASVLVLPPTPPRKVVGVESRPRAEEEENRQRASNPRRWAARLYITFGERKASERELQAFLHQH